MSQHMIKCTFTTQAWAAFVENPQNRFDIIRPVYEAVGAKLLNYWFAVDQAAAYILVEAPASEDTVKNQLALTTFIMGTGTIASAESTRLLTAAEAVDSMKKAKALRAGAAAKK